MTDEKLVPVMVRSVPPRMEQEVGVTLEIVEEVLNDIGDVSIIPYFEAEVDSIYQLYSP